ncbi:hypothetical protein [Campylobacter sp. RM16191]|uniref:hypothetical protein n=1 Tax=Campylobacter sp. RM16191 TaxID=1705728 RepID=UPI001472E569|nr:hypothetical protein [Campylobacter sp. RM16191]
MKRTEYLYGVSLDKIPSADEHFKEKIKAGEKLVRELLEAPYSERDFTRIDDVLKAIEFNRKVLNKEI